MRRRRGLLVALAAACLAAPAAAQPPRRDPGRSPIRIPGDPVNREALEDLLSRELQGARDLGIFRDLVENVLDNPDNFNINPNDPAVAKLIEQFRKNREKLPFDVNDPRLRDLIEKAKKSGKLTPEQIEAIKNRLPPERPKQPDGTQPDKPVKPPDQPTTPPNEGQPGPTPGGTPPGTPMPGGQPPTPAPTPRTTSPPSRPERADNRSWLPRQVGRLRGLGGDLTSGLRDRVRGMFGSRSGVGRLTRGMTGGPRRYLPSLGGGGGVTKLLDGLRGAVPRDVRVRPLPRPGGGGNSSAGLPAVSGPSGEGVGTAVLVVLALAGVGVLVWVLLAGGAWVRRRRAEGWKLGPWPVEPDDVRTRSDIVKAFEYLAMLLLGRKATTAHHLAIAGQLSTERPDQTGRTRNAAEELAVLYEHARYAPPDEPLSADEVASARRDLTFLAGGQAA